MKHRKGLFFIRIISIVIGLIIVCVVPFKKDIDVSLNGVEFQIHSSEYKSATINIEGQYCKYLLRPNVFEGKIQVEGYDFTFSDYYYVNTSFINGYGHLNYTGVINGSIYGKFLGLIYTEDFEKILICIYDKKINNSSERDDNYTKFICAPATSIEEAKNIYISIVEERSWSKNN
ncbi:hypothetical protein [Proteiniborus sp. MB09-C3]|uniref:hypothetical protein n=1 Tax=Proteiniborus sp. MB09-C3 TaxID=3050072 RepID=UPI002555E8D5|nr:hypothetical protein [Proteiniborus sp. MB09-C3]WIV13509.1 hypothetical protein QO263_07325 [Proteiniborus sp. MB09-C3]